MNNRSNSKRLVKNTAYMYLRMLFMTLISLYTSRVILNQLGVEDYGIYNVVGSIVLLFSSLKTIFAQSTQRFLNYEMGKGNYDKLNMIFNISAAVNLIIVAALVVGVEAVGTWFLEYKVNVAPDRLFATKIIFQCSIVATVFSLMTNPFNACIIAHERMDFYAGLSIVEAILRLVICFVLPFGGFDKLVLYGVLMMVINIVVFLISWIYCRHQFSECRYSKAWDKEYFKKLTSFAGWSFLGNTSYALSQSGVNLVLNVFGGPVVNAARGVAYQINSTLQGVVSNIVVVVRPYFTQTYASGQVDKAMDLIYFSSKLYFYIQMVLVVCFTFICKYIIELWLGQIPEYSIVFINLVLFHSLVKSLCGPIDMLFFANGNIKWYQIIEGIILALPLPLSYIALGGGAPYSSVFVIMIICEILHVLAICYLAKNICGLNFNTYIKAVIKPCLFSVLLFLGGYVLSMYFCNYLFGKILAALVTLGIITVFLYKLGLDQKEKSYIKQLATSIVFKKNSKSK